MVSNPRPIERRVNSLHDRGLSLDEIAWRFRRSPGSIRRILTLSQIDRRVAEPSTTDPLRPVERLVLASRERGWSTTETAARLRRSPAWVERVEVFGRYKLS